MTFINSPLLACQGGSSGDSGVNKYYNIMLSLSAGITSYTPSSSSGLAEGPGGGHDLGKVKEQHTPQATL